MAAWTLEQAQEKLATWMAADDAIATGQSYEIDVGNSRRKLTRADADMVQEKIKFWALQVNQLQMAANSGTGAGPKIRYINPV